MRFDGTLKTWNAERGFGFITPRTGGQDIFIHISVFPRDGHPPREGEVLTFEVESTPDGKKRAARVQRPGQQSVAASSKSRRSAPERRGGGLGSTVIGLVLLAGLGWYGYGMFEQRMAVRTQAAQPVSAAAADAFPVGNSRCDGRVYCSQMTSCREAKFFLKNCPGVKMDGNRDGVPCEEQWCTGPFAD